MSWFQTRSETSGCVQHTSLKACFEAWERDPTIWKISCKNERWIVAKNDKGEIFWQNRPFVFTEHEVTDEVSESMGVEDFRRHCNEGPGMKLDDYNDVWQMKLGTDW